MYAPIPIFVWLVENSHLFTKCIIQIFIISPPYANDAYLFPHNYWLRPGCGTLAPLHNICLFGDGIWLHSKEALIWHVAFYSQSCNMSESQIDEAPFVAKRVHAKTLG